LRTRGNNFKQTFPVGSRIADHISNGITDRFKRLNQPTAASQQAQGSLQAQAIDLSNQNKMQGLWSKQQPKLKSMSEEVSMWTFFDNVKKSMMSQWETEIVKRGRSIQHQQQELNPLHSS